MTTGAARRSDAARNVERILDAASEVLARDANATVADVARAAGLARQTVYAHFGSREALILAVLRRSAQESAAVLGDAEIERDSAVEALLRFVEHGWDALERHSALLANPSAQIAAAELQELHAPITHRLEHLARQGQRSGAFAKGLAPAWIASMTIACIHAAGEAVRTGHAAPATARKALLETLRRIYGIPHHPSR
jgi:AcrR family transcriptional regulator